MADVNKIQLPDNSTVNIKDYRIPGVDTEPTSGSDNIITSGGIYQALVDDEEVISAALNDLDSRLTNIESTDFVTTAALNNAVASKYTKPATGIPASDLASGVIPDVSGKYEKPSTGIPKTDLAQGVQDSLARADSALQSFTETDPTVPSWAKAQNPPTEIFWATYGTTTAAEIDAAISNNKLVAVKYAGRTHIFSGIIGTNYYFNCANGGQNIASVRISDGVWYNGGSIALQQIAHRVTSWGATPSDAKYPSEKLVKDSLDGKQPLIDSTHKLDYSLIDNTPTIPAVPTISTDIQADKNSTTKTAAPSAVYNEVHPAVASSQPQNGFLPNVLYNLGTLTGSVTFALATPADATIVNHYYWTFETGSTAPTITWPAGVTWLGGSAPTINADKHYEISVLNGIGTSMEV